MSQPSEERLSDQAPLPASPPSAKVLPFARHPAEPQSELQRAVLVRAQESLERERARDREFRRVSPLRWIIVSALALIPVALMVIAVDGFLRAWHKYNEVAIKSQPAPEAPAPVVEESEPGVVILQSYDGEKKKDAAPTEAAKQ